jgi:hypothetical protein
MKTMLALAIAAATCGEVRPPVAPNVAVPVDTATQCDKVCQAMGLTLSAVVVVSDRSGCVCERAPGTSAPKIGGATASAAGTLFAMLDEEEAERQRLQQEQMMEEQRRQQEEQQRQQQQQQQIIQQQQMNLPH